MNKKIAIAVIIIIAGIGVYITLDQQSSPTLNVMNFEECAKAGYPVGESYPRQCWTPDGGHFVEEINIPSVDCPMDAMQCPDGSYIGRTGPKCEFVCPNPTTKENQFPGGGCVISGCSGEICAEENRVSICIYLPEHVCYQAARCERQGDNRCGWTMTEELTACLTNIKSR